jgi:hypothetical protein
MDEVIIKITEGGAITKEQVEAVLTGDITTHNHDTQLAVALGVFGDIAYLDFWIGTQAEYDALPEYNETTLYFTTE